MSKGADDVDRWVGARMRQARTAARLSQERLADALGVTFQQVQKYENGRNRVSASRLRTTADLLGVPLVYFYEGLADAGNAADASPHPSGAHDVHLSEEGLRLVRAFGRIADARVRGDLLRLIETLAGEA